MTNFLFPLPSHGNHAAHVSVLQGPARGRMTYPSFEWWTVPPKSFGSPFFVEGPTRGERVSGLRIADLAIWVTSFAGVTVT